MRGDFDDMVFQKDLIYYEGSLIAKYSYFGRPYIFYWADTNGITNRWLVTTNKNEVIDKFEHSEISIRDFFEDGEDCFVLDIASDDVIVQGVLVPVDQVDEYLPQDDVTLS